MRNIIAKNVHTIIKVRISIMSQPVEVGFKSRIITSSSFKLIEKKLNKELVLFSYGKCCRKFDFLLTSSAIVLPML